MARELPRGAYRPIYSALLDGGDFQKLTPAGRLLLFVVKVMLPAMGIGVVPALIASLEERSGLDTDSVKSGLAELVEHGWVERERSIVWLVRGFEFEPNLDPRDRRHRKHVQHHVHQLPRCELVQRYKSKYAIWFSDEALEDDRASDGPAKAQRRPKPGPAKALDDSQALARPYEGPAQGQRSRLPLPLPESVPDTRLERVSTPSAVGAPRSSDTPATTAALDDDLLELVPESYHGAILGYLKAAANPPAVRNAIRDTIHGGAAYPTVDGATTGRALAEMLAAGRPFTPRTLRAFIQGLKPLSPATSITAALEARSTR